MADRRWRLFHAEVMNPASKRIVWPPLFQPSPASGGRSQIPSPAGGGGPGWGDGLKEFAA